MRIGLFTDGLKHLSRRDAFAWCVEHGITDVEMSVGTWGARTHLDQIPARRFLAGSRDSQQQLRSAHARTRGNA